MNNVPDFMTHVPNSPPRYEGEVFDRTLHATFAKSLGWFSPIAFILSVSDWWLHLIISPAKIAEISRYSCDAYLKWYRDYCFNNTPGVSLDKCKPGDTRFHDPSWQQFPFNFYANSFLLFEDTIGYATSRTPGVARHNNQVVNFLTRQFLDMFSPSNSLWMNPEIIQKTMLKSGANITNGITNFMDDYLRITTKAPAYGTDKYKVGTNVATTPGKVVYRNNLIELIQYTPITAQAYKEPVLIVPAWIMKYYILDLSPNNSMVKYLLEQGHTVFMISWKNPTTEDRTLGLNDYVNLGVMAALKIINNIIPNTKVNMVGYCIGGTLLMIAAAAMAGENDDRIASITLFAAQVDFKDAGELTIFIDTSQVSYLEDIMWEKGYLDGSQMAGAFSMLHSSELIWSRFVRDYFLGERKELSDLMAWDNDTTRLPLRMHSEYLRKLFLNNDLVQGQYSVNDKFINLSNITVPIFAVGTATDHVAPWQSVYKIHFFVKSDITFVLTSGGHNVGIVNPPDVNPTRVHKTYQMLDSRVTDKRVSYDLWQDSAPVYEGSWWPAWIKWLQNVSPETGPLPSMGVPGATPAILGDAPGKYIL